MVGYRAGKPRQTIEFNFRLADIVKSQAESVKPCGRKGTIIPNQKRGAHLASSGADRVSILQKLLLEEGMEMMSVMKLHLCGR
jgi:hypothetical protein